MHHDFIVRANVMYIALLFDGYTKSRIFAGTLRLCTDYLKRLRFTISCIYRFIYTILSAMYNVRDSDLYICICFLFGTNVFVNSS